MYKVLPDLCRRDMSGYMQNKKNKKKETTKNESIKNDCDMQDVV